MQTGLGRRRADELTITFQPPKLVSLPDPCWRPWQFRWNTGISGTKVSYLPPWGLLRRRRRFDVYAHRTAFR